MTKIIPAERFSVLGDKYRESQRPVKTPSKLVLISAKAAPAKIMKGFLNSALIRTIVTCVLSPNSANKMVTKVEKKTPQAVSDRGEGLSGEGMGTGVSGVKIASRMLQDRLNHTEQMEINNNLCHLFRNIQAKAIVPPLFKPRLSFLVGEVVLNMRWDKVNLLSRSR